jgi:hypothetical protein
MLQGFYLYPTIARCFHHRIILHHSPYSRDITWQSFQGKAFLFKPIDIAHNQSLKHMTKKQYTRLNLKAMNSVPKEFERCMAKVNQVPLCSSSSHLGPFLADEKVGVAALLALI